VKRRWVLAGRRLRRTARSVAAMPPAQLGLRATLAAAGGLALLIAPAGQLLGAGLVALIALPALVAAVLRPDGGGPAVVMAAAAGAWAMRYGTASAPLDTALALAALLYLHHTTAALCAAMPPAAAVAPAVLLRWATQVAVVFALTAAAAAALRAVGHAPAAPALEVAGLAAAVGLAGLLVALARAAARRRPSG